MDENLLLLKFLSRFFHWVAFIWEFKVLKVISIFPRSSLDFCIFNLLRPRGLFVKCIRFPQIYFVESCSGFYRALEDRTKLVLNLPS